MIPNSLSRAEPNRCRNMFNWIPGSSATLRPPPQRQRSASTTVEHTGEQDDRWWVTVARKEEENAIVVSQTAVGPDGTARMGVTRKYRKEVGLEPILMHEIARALSSLLENPSLLKSGSIVIVSSALVRTALASPLISQSALAHLITETRRIKTKTGHPVHFATKMDSKAKEELALLLENSSELDLTPSPFSDLGVVKRVITGLRNLKWQREWVDSPRYFSSKNKMLPHAAQTKLWYPTAERKDGITTLGRPSLGDAIQFLTGHGWFRRHRAKIDENNSQCRFCDNDIEDPEHLWSSCEHFSGVRQDIKQLCQNDGTIVSFEHPFIWSAQQLMSFLRDVSMAELLTGPGVQQIPL